MRKIYILFLFCLSASMTIGQEQMNKPLIAKVTADWCPTCGSWGWTFMERIIEEIPSTQATILSIHHSGNLETDETNEIAQNLMSVGQPVFYLNNSKISVSSSTIDTRIESLKEEISEINTTTPEWGINVSANRAGDNFTGQIDITAMQDVAGTFYVSAYYVVNDIEHPQAGSVTNNIHKKIVKGNFFDEVYGENFASGSIASGESYTIPLNKDFELEGETYDIVAIIWRNEGSTYFVSNTDVKENVLIVSSVSDLNELDGDAYLNGNNSLIMNLNAEKSIGEYKVSLVSLSGASKILAHSSVAANQLFEEYDLSDLTSGTYILRLESEAGLWTKKINLLK